MEGLLGYGSEIESRHPMPSGSAVFLGNRTLSKSKMQGPQIEEGFQCTVCYENYSDFTEIFSFDCGHQFCVGCTKEQINFHVERAEVDKLVCFTAKCRT